MVICARLTPGTKLAQPDNRVYGRISTPSCLRIAMADVPNHVNPWRVLSLLHMYSPCPVGLSLLAFTSSEYLPSPLL